MKNISKNSITCPNCNKSNPVYSNYCLHCGSFIREKINTLDMWKTIWNLFVEPKSTFTNIIYSRNKNGIIILLPFLVWILFSWISILLNYNGINLKYINSTFRIYSATLGLFVVSISIWAFLVKFIFSKINYYSRFKDNFALLIYSFSPWILSFFVLLLVKLGLFGEFWFTFKPEPWVIKPFSAYFIITFEGLFLLWSIILFYLSQIVYFKSKLIAIITNSLFYLILFALTLIAFLFLKV